MEKRRQRKTAGTVGRDSLALGAVLAGLAGAIGIAVAANRQKLVVGGVDLSSVDLSQPFWVSFSVEPHSPTMQKRVSYRRMMVALAELQGTYPSWLIESSVDAQNGVFMLFVHPTATQAQSVIRSLVTS